MLRNRKTGFMQWLHKNFTRAASHFSFAVLILILVASPASATTVFSDSWFDDSGGANRTYEEGEAVTGLYVVGCGLTEANYGDDWELHSVRATTTIRSPNGRVVTLTSTVYYNWNQGSSFTARAEPKLQWDIYNPENGDYIVSTRHFSTCPSTELGNTTDRVKRGQSMSCWDLGGIRGQDVQDCFYRPITPCVVNCRPDEIVLLEFHPTAAR